MALDHTARKISEELEVTRLNYHNLVEAIPQDNWKSRTNHPTWTVAEVLFHMILALRYLPGDVRLIRRVKRIPKFPGFIFHRWNEWRTRRGGQTCTPDSLLEDYDKAHFEVLAILNTFPVEDWNQGAIYPGWDPLLNGFVSFESLFRYPVRHLKAHAKDIEQHTGIRFDEDI